MAKTETGIKLIEKFIQRPIELHLLCKSQNFPDLNSFLHLIDPDNPHNIKTVESYLFGNKLTRKFPRQTLIDQYHQWAKPEIAQAAAKILPEIIFPTHFFQVAFIASKDPGDPITKINGCAIFPGEIISINHNLAIVRRPLYPSFNLVEQKIELSPNHHFTIGDQVAIHLGSAFTKLTAEQFNNLDTWNHRVAALI